MLYWLAGYHTLNATVSTLRGTLRNRRTILAVIVVTYLFTATLYALYTPRWQAPDEPAHYNYVQELATRGTFPVLQPGDYDAAYQARVVTSRFDPQYSIAPFRYEFHQPPLYYLLALPVYTLTRGAVLPLRLLSVLIGAVLVVVVYALGRRVFPQVPAIALGAAAFTAFLPMHVTMLAAVNNDGLAELLIALLLLLCVHVVQLPDPDPRQAAVRWRWLGIGLVLGLGLITKSTVYTMIPVVLVAMTATVWRVRRQAPQRASAVFAWALLLVGLPVLLLALPWWLRNLSVYGGTDFLGLQRHDEVVVGQLRTAQFVAEQGWAALVSRFGTWTFRSFWGQFGWMSVLMDARIYVALLGLSVTAAVGAAFAVLQAWRGGEAQARWAWLLLGAALLGALAGYLGYNLSFVQHQARYLFPAIPVIALLFAAGLDAVVRQPWVSRAAAGVLALVWLLSLVAGADRWTLLLLAVGIVILLVLPLLRRWSGLVYAVPFVGMALLAVVSLFWFVVPVLGGWE